MGERSREMGDGWTIKEIFYSIDDDFMMGREERRGEENKRGTSKHTYVLTLQL